MSVCVVHACVHVCVCVSVSYMELAIGVGESVYPVTVYPHCHPKQSGEGQSCHY